jgi:hypothetical protein
MSYKLLNSGAIQKSTFCPSSAAEAGNCLSAMNILTLGKCMVNSIIENVGALVVLGSGIGHSFRVF